MNSPAPIEAPAEKGNFRALGLFTPQMLRDEIAKEQPRFVIDGFVAERSVNLLVGDNGIGKTPFLMAMGMAVAAGQPFLGKAVTQGRVLYLDAEMGQQQFIELMETLAKHFT